MARLGLRAGEVASLQLDDIDWRAGELVVHGKGQVRSRLPLPVDVGEAIAEYLQRADRSHTACSVFVRCRAPYSSLSSGGVVAIAKTAIHEAGFAGGAHRLRHTAATQMLRKGASLTEDRAGPEAPACKHHRDLRQGRSRSPSRAGPRMAQQRRRRLVARAGLLVAGRCRVSALAEKLADYLRVQRALGFKQKQAGELLPAFVRYLDARGMTRVTTTAALAWATLPRDRDPNWWSKRLTVVRGFAKYLHALDPRSEVHRRRSISRLVASSGDPTSTSQPTSRRCSRRRAR